MIVNSHPLSLAEVKALVKDTDESKPIHAYLKAFCKISVADAKKLAEEILALNNPKIRNHHIVKIIDLLPQDSEEVNKIITDVSMSEEESHTLTEVVKKY
ncbi:hypothetical protein HYZ97_01995 [Candidatus Pacearchaeota archaeon]|nr:hypothetical protein [Candidatus Pacearchaeota archaeon]